MLELLGKDFKAVMIIMINGVKGNMLITNEKRNLLAEKQKNIEKRTKWVILTGKKVQYLKLIQWMAY